jgi:hypothetical protein
VAPIGAIPEDRAFELDSAAPGAYGKLINVLRIVFFAGCLLVSALDALAETPARDNVPADVTQQSAERIVWLSALLLVLGPLFLWHRWRFVRSKASMPPTMLAPEILAPAQMALSRNALVPHFIQWLKSRSVQQLILQREELLTTQRLAEMELAKLEQMLTDVHAPLQQRLREYEQRIAELEQALKLKDEQSAELIQTMLRLTRQKLEAERASESDTR